MRGNEGGGGKLLFWDMHGGMVRFGLVGTYRHAVWLLRLTISGLELGSYIYLRSDGGGGRWRRWDLGVGEREGREPNSSSISSSSSSL